MTTITIDKELALSTNRFSTLEEAAEALLALVGKTILWEVDKSELSADALAYLKELDQTPSDKFLDI